jgi:hypothetical protein
LPKFRDFDKSRNFEASQQRREKRRRFYIILERAQQISATARLPAIGGVAKRWRKFWNQSYFNFIFAKKLKN